MTDTPSYERELSELRGKLTTVSADLDHLQRDLASLQHLPEELRRLRQRQDEHAERADRTDHNLDELAEELHRTRQAMDKLADRVRWLWQHASRTDNTEFADFDRLVTELGPLADTAERGRAAAAELLPGHRRTALQALLDRQQTLLHDRAIHRASVIAAARTLTTTGRTDPEHTRAATALTDAADAERTCASALEELRPRATQARIDLKSDEARRAQHAETITQGEQADQTLRQRLYTHLADALHRHVMMPAWFETRLGPLAPATGTEEWMDLAIDVLAYRITHRITDPVLALGPRPSDTPARIHAQRQSIEDALDDLRP